MTARGVTHVILCFSPGSKQLCKRMKLLAFKVVLFGLCRCVLEIFTSVCLRHIEIVERLFTWQMRRDDVCQ
jgi:hypothetical protein